MRKQLAILFALVLIAISVRVLTLQFMRAHLDDPAWFQTGTYAKFDRHARDILDGRQKLFWIDDATRTDLVQYPPAFPALLALIYKVTGYTSVYSAQLVLWAADVVLSLLLIAGIAASAFGWRAAIATGFLVALSPLFAMYSAYPSADLPATWFVLGGNWLLLLALQRRHLWLAIGAGVLLGSRVRLGEPLVDDIDEFHRGFGFMRRRLPSGAACSALAIPDNRASCQ